MRRTKKDDRLRIVFYDGECGFCQFSVQTIISLDSDARISFAPLQGETAKKVLPEELRRDAALQTMVYAEEQHNASYVLHTESTAVLAVLSELGGLWWCLSWLRIIPSALRDPVYRVVAKNRGKLASRVSCRVLSEEEQSRFLA